MSTEAIAAEAATEKVVAVPGSKETLTACEELKSELADLKEITIMVMGKSGVGKTSLIKVICKTDSAVVGQGAGPATNPACTTYTIKNEDLTINFFDTPGLYDDEDAYVEMVKNKAGKADIIFFCVDMSSNLCGDDRTALQLIGKHFSPKFLEKTVFVLTKANRVERFGDDAKSFTKDEYFKMVLREKISEIVKRLQQANLAIDQRSLRIVIAGSPGSCEVAGEERVISSETTEVNGVRVHVNLSDYNIPELWVATLFVTCIYSGATDSAKLGLVKMYTHSSNWKKWAAAGAGVLFISGGVGVLYLFRIPFIAQTVGAAINRRVVKGGSALLVSALSAAAGAIRETMSFLEV